MIASGTTVKAKTYIAGIAVVTEPVSGGGGAADTMYMLRDHLGSTDVVTDATGARSRTGSPSTPGASAAT